MKKSTIVSNLVFVAIFLVAGCTQKPSEVSEKTDDPTKPVRVGPEGYNSSLSYYGTTPESPDGSKIAFVVFLEETKENRNETVPAEIWYCNSDLTNYQKVVSINPIATHNGARVQWLDNNSIAYQDDSVRTVDLQGNALSAPVEGRIGHHTYDNKFLYAAIDYENNLYTIYEYDVKNGKINTLANSSDFKGLLDQFSDPEFLPWEEWRILHLQYNTDGTKISFRLDIGPRNETYRYLVTMNYDGSDVKYFGPKPMHFLWYDDKTVIGHDLQTDDGLKNDKSLRRWTLDRKVVETLAGPGNHLGASPDRNFYGSESWYGADTIFVNVFRKNELNPIWQDIASTDPHTTWTLAYHTNPNFSMDNKRVYYNKCVAPGKVQVYMAEFLNKGKTN